MGLDANLRQGQNFAKACRPDLPPADRLPLVPACAAAAAVVRHDSRDLAKDGFASEQDDDMLGDLAGDAFLAPGA